jgi:hypothetical protein
MSLNQKNIEKTTPINPKYNILCRKEKLCIDKAVLTVKTNKKIDVLKGQGEGDTK